MRTRSLFLFAAFVLLTLGLAASASAQGTSDDVRALLEERDREIKAILGDRDEFTPAQRERLQNVINSAISFEAMSRTALGPFWSDLSAAERAHFVDVFGGIVRAQSLSDLGIYRAPVTYGQITVDGSTARAVTQTNYRDVTTDVIYVMGYDDGAWQVHDIIIDDVSTAEGYARSFQNVIRKRSFETLVETLERRLERTQQ